MTPAEILQEIGQIRRMVQGKISDYDPNTQGRTYYNLSSYVGGKSTTHIREDQKPALEHLIGEHLRFRRLMKEYEEAVVRRTRAELGLPMRSPRPQPAAPEVGVQPSPPN
jgi:hypothetical protein